MKKFILFYNPLSGKADFKNKIDSFIKEMHQYGALIIPIRTSQREDAALIEQLILQIEITGILIAGGDGTLRETVNFLCQKGIDLPIGIIPAGTSNDLANFLGLNNDLAACAAIFNAGKTRPLDVGRVNGQYFLNTASIGTAANVAHSTNTALKNTLGKIAYYLKVALLLPQLQPIPLKINLDSLVVEDEVFLFVAGNSKTVGGFAAVLPYALLDDGKLDTLIIKKCPLWELILLLPALLKGDHIHSKYVTYLQASRITAEGSPLIESDLDGELGPFLPLTIEVVPKKILVYAPDKV
ncbi:MAG: YegS/Rv2252/BmrU family lipid kinase [Sporomusaceae bacterium]|jgi:YegS/Rv2252/BmrU family lipid kinase|nr:YegS/Rv2252/BmrU family lipid kinase [Sporomusaceae bacterium]